MTDKKQMRAEDERLERERAALAAKVGADDYELPADVVVHAGTAQTRAAAKAMLLEAAGTDEERDLIRSVGGRPALDPAGNASVSWRLRVPPTLDERFLALVKEEGRPFSAVLRSAAEEYIAAHSMLR